MRCFGCDAEGRRRSARRHSRFAGFAAATKSCHHQPMSKRCNYMHEMMMKHANHEQSRAGGISAFLGYYIK
jgi:hypothetical protein